MATNHLTCTAKLFSGQTFIGKKNQSFFPFCQPNTLEEKNNVWFLPNQTQI